MRRRADIIVAALMVLVVAGLVAAGIGRLRQTADRQACANNLRQLGLALHNYHDTFQRFPAGTVANPALTPEKRLSWLVEITPFADQCTIVIDRTKAWDAEENREPNSRYLDDDSFDENQERVEQFRYSPVGQIRYLTCPANPSTFTPGMPGLTHYVGIAGVGPESPEFPRDYPNAGFFGYEASVPATPKGPGLGLRMEDIRDGTGTTLAALETATANGYWTAGGPATVRALDPHHPPYLGRSGQFSSGHQRGTGGLLRPRPYVTNALFGDASVRSLSESMSPQVLEALATIAGGEEVPPLGDE
jgi:hypothetical protein